MNDNTILNVGAGGDTVRDLARLGGTVKTQVVQLDLGGASANGEVLITAGRQTMAASVPVVLASDQPALPVTGSFYQATQPVSIATMPTTAVTGSFYQTTQPVSGAFYQTTQPVSIATMPTTAVTIAAMPSTPVTGTFFQATQPVSGAFFQTTQPVSIAGTVTVATGLVQAATDAQMRASALPVLQAALTKGTQGAQGVTVQDLKDAGRSRVAIVFQAAAPAVADTLLSLVKMNAGVAAAGATSIGVTTGKVLRITAITLSLKANAAASAFATLTLRTNPAGATLISSLSEVRLDVGATGATIGAADKVEIIFPDGLEFSGAQTIGISLAAQAITNIVSIGINGFEY